MNHDENMHDDFVVVCISLALIVCLPFIMFLAALLLAAAAIWFFVDFLIEAWRFACYKPIYIDDDFTENREVKQ